MLGPRNANYLNKIPRRAPPSLMKLWLQHWPLPLRDSPHPAAASGMSSLPGLCSTLPSSSQFSQPSTSSAPRTLSHQDRRRQLPDHSTRSNDSPHTCEWVSHSFKISSNNTTPWCKLELGTCFLSLWLHCGLYSHFRFSLFPHTGISVLNFCIALKTLLGTC